MKLLKTVLVAVTLSLCGCTSNSDKLNPALTEEGVSIELANHRLESLGDVNYKLHFDIPENTEQQVKGNVEISLTKNDNSNLILDFFAPVGSVHSLKVNSTVVEEINHHNQHIIIPAKLLKAGQNIVNIEFSSTNTGLNRRDEFIYTLLVPDRARTLFPLFDQPSIKAKYALSLTVPSSWSAISQTRISKESKLEGGRKFVEFANSEPISSYLFSFVAGKFEYVSSQRNGHEHRIYHRESDPKRIAQFDDIFNELFHSLDYLEEYTNTPYPFSKYDMVLIPGFQYGGMEHIGATIYRASIMFLPPTPTIDQRISRAKLVAHETAHMWFGDLVTMEWFDDVWTKEVFANYFGAKIVAPLFPELDERQSMLNYFALAYNEDRTVGGTSIKQELDNLKYAGLVYNSIIYNKSPLVLDMIAEKMGDEPLKSAIREVFKKHYLSTARWEDWLQEFDNHTTENLKSWSHNWMYENGMPHITINRVDGGVTISQRDPKGRSLIWEQFISFKAIDSQGKSSEHKHYLSSSDTTITLGFTPKYIIPNSDGRGYGYFDTESASMDYMLANLSKTTSSIERRMALITIFDNILNKPTIKSVEQLINHLNNERDALLYSTTLGYVTQLYKTYGTLLTNDKKELTKIGNILDSTLWNIVNNKNVSAGIRATSFKTIYSLLLTDKSINSVRDHLYKQSAPKGLQLSEREYMTIAMNLAQVLPKNGAEILADQERRIINPDNLEEFKFISRAVNPTCNKQELFIQLLKEENRTVEKWVEQTLGYLTNSRADIKTANSFITPALDILPEIQRTGDIFFPQGWCRALLSGNTSNEAFLIVDSVLNNNKNMHPMLRSKLLISADHLYRLHK